MYIDCTECLNAPFGAQCFLTIDHWENLYGDYVVS